MLSCLLASCTAMRVAQSVLPYCIELINRFQCKPKNRSIALIALLAWPNQTSANHKDVAENIWMKHLLYVSSGITKSKFTALVIVSVVVLISSLWSTVGILLLGAMDLVLAERIILPSREWEWAKKQWGSQMASVWQDAHLSPAISIYLS